MNAKQFYDWQTAGGTNDVMRLVDCLERADVAWCAIGGVAVNHSAKEPMVTQDFDLVIAVDSLVSVLQRLEDAGFTVEQHAWSVNLRGSSKVSIQISTSQPYLDYPQRAVPADVHGILLRVASLEDTLEGKVLAWQDDQRRQSKRLKNLGDIARLVESHPALWLRLPNALQQVILKPV